jgi:large conductance mechanosensitive channel
MAVGVVVGGAFSKIVSSLVADIINPLVGLATGKVELSDMKYILQPEIIDAATDTVTQAEIALKYGNFLQMIIDFLIIAFSIFVVIKVMMGTQKKLESLKRKKEEEAAEAAPTTKVCPFCKSEIAIDATRCAHCTSEVE